MTHRSQILLTVLLALAATGTVHAQCADGKASYDQGRQIGAHYHRVCPQACLEQRRYFYQRAVAACPEESRYHNDLADVHEKLGQYDLAIEHYNHAIELAPHLAIPYFGLGNVHFLRQDYKQAIAAYKQGLEHEPDDKLARRFLLEAEARLSGEDDSKISGFGAVMSVAPAETRLALHIHFETDRHDLTPVARTELKRLVRQMGPILEQQPGTRFLIEGHTDVRGTDQHNLDLSINRARTVAETLANAHAIPADALAIQGFGESRPLKTGLTNAEHSLNRRVEIVRLNRPQLAALVENRWAEPMDEASQPQLEEFMVSVGVLLQDIGGLIKSTYSSDGRPSPLFPGQGYRLYFRLAQPSHVYVFQVTGGDAVTLLWPRDGSAKVMANAPYWLPNDKTDDWLKPPADPGQSATLYLVASRVPTSQICCADQAGQTPTLRGRRPHLSSTTDLCR